MNYKIKRKRIKQINNLTIYFSEDMYDVFSPDDRCLEEFHNLENAEKFCKNTKDFIKRGKQ